jgi:hypothetical protein
VVHHVLGHANVERIHVREPTTAFSCHETLKQQPTNGFRLTKSLMLASMKNTRGSVCPRSSISGGQHSKLKLKSKKFQTCRHGILV